jgi:hypothetical protein
MLAYGHIIIKNETHATVHVIIQNRNQQIAQIVPENLHSQIALLAFSASDLFYIFCLTCLVSRQFDFSTFLCAP